LVADAHGRLLDLAPGNQAPRTEQIITAQPTATRRQRVSTAVAVAVILAGGLVVSVLLIVVRDIVTTLAGGGITSLVLQALLRLCNRKER
jgi:hypothetical protein